MKMVELSRRPFHPSVVAACLVSLLALIGSPALWAQCTDTDNDGFFYEAGCGTAQDCNDADPNTNPDAPEVCDGYDNDCDGAIDNDPGCNTACDSPDEDRRRRPRNERFIFFDRPRASQTLVSVL